MKVFLASMALALAATTSAQQAPPAPAATAPLPALQTRAAEWLAILQGGGDLQATLSREILAAVPEAQFRVISAQLAASMGKPLAVAAVEPRGPDRAQVTVRYERGQAKFSMVVAQAAPNRIIGMRVLEAGPPVATLGEVVEQLKALPGATGFALADLGPGAPRLVQGLAPDTSLALGSAFKLVVLAELVREIEAGQRRWDDLVTLDGTERPAGGYNLKPKGTQVSLRELARQMISISDNSATDILIDTLGREKIEAMQATVGIRAPARNRPLLTLMEAFKLKGVGNGALGTRYLALDEKGRRALLAGEVRATPGSAIGSLFADGKPVRIDTLEWFASPADLVRVMDWLRRHSESGPGAEARTILAINPGLPGLTEHYAYVGFKGGSEPGVLNLTLLLRTKAGPWKVLTAGWNNPAAPLEEIRFFGLVNRAGELAAQ